MDKIQLTVLGLSASPAGNNAYALILKEIDGRRRLPIVIGTFEAQSIALEMEGYVPPRPMTHDLIKNCLDAVGLRLDEVFINELKEGTFHSKLIIGDYEIDARASDAIAMAVRYDAPIFVDESIIDEAGVVPPSDEAFNDNFGDIKSKNNKAPHSILDNLQMQLDNAISEEDYEKAANLRDEIKKILEKQ